MATIGLSNIKTENMKNILNLVSATGPMTRSDMAKQSELSLMTITNLIDQLQELRLVRIENNKKDNKYGRKAQLITMDDEKHRILILDLAQRNFGYSIFDVGLKQEKKHRKYKLDAESSYLENLERFLSQTVAEISQRYDDIIGVGVCVPGPYVVEEDKVVNRRILSIRDISLKSVISRHIPDKMIYINEDVKFAAYANVSSLPGFEEKLAVYLHIGEGVGGTIMYKSKILRGLNNITGDMGQIMAGRSVNFEELISFCGFYKSVTGEEWADLSDDEAASSLSGFRRDNPSEYETRLTELYENISTLLCNILWIIDPHIIQINCEYAHIIDDNFNERLLETFDKRIDSCFSLRPEVLFHKGNIKDSYAGAAKEIISRWLSDVICNA